jgi:hypothetical protein
VRDGTVPSGKRNCKEQEEIFDQTGDQKIQVRDKIKRRFKRSGNLSSKGGAMPETDGPLQVPCYVEESEYISL